MKLLLVHVLHVFFASAGALFQLSAAALHTLDNGVIAVGVDTARGGSITHLSQSGKNQSVINVYDMGREVQLSFYSGPDSYEPSPGSQACNTTWHRGNWPWNPIGAGDVAGHSGEVLSIQEDPTKTSLYVRSRPLQWACDKVPCECVFEKWIRLDGTAVVVDARLSNARSDHTAYSVHNQELPAVYTVGTLYRLFSYNGTEPFTDGPLTEFDTTGAIWTPGNFLASEHWAAMTDASGDWGLGVFHPQTVAMSGGFAGKGGSGGPSDANTGYIAPNHFELLDWNITYNFSFHLILGNLKDIRTYAYQQQTKGLIPACFNSVFSLDRQHFYYENAADTGVPRAAWHVIMELDDPQLIGPPCLWNAQEHHLLLINASFSSVQASTSAQVFWNKNGIHASFTEENSVHFSITADEKFHTYTVNLSQSPNYSGTIFGIRFDPVEAGTKGAFVDLVSITLT